MGAKKVYDTKGGMGHPNSSAPDCSFLLSISSIKSSPETRWNIVTAAIVGVWWSSYEKIFKLEHGLTMRLSNVYELGAVTFYEEIVTE